MVTKKEIFNDGYDRGYNIASWQELPEIGSEIQPFRVSQFYGKIKTVIDAREAFMAICYDVEENDRQFSPFEFTAHDLNELEDKKPYDVWEIFENGIQKGFYDNWRERAKQYYSKGDFRRARAIKKEG